MFALTKVLAFLAQPSTLAALAMLAGLVLLRSAKRARFGARLAWGGFAYFVVAGLTPLGNALLLPLEERFAGVAAPVPGDRVDGIILLGGFEDGWVSAARPGLAVNESAERLTESVRLARRHPESRLVFTGGVASVLFRGAEGAGPVGEFLRDAGIDGSRIVLESRSRDTYENAVMTKELLRPSPDERWLLVTSAYHMPRAVGLFRKAGFGVMPYPVDFRTRGSEDLVRFFGRIPAGLMRTDLAAREWLGLVSYRIVGRIDELLPGP